MTAEARQYQLGLTKRMFTGQEVPDQPEWKEIGGFPGEPSEDRTELPSEIETLSFSQDWNAKLSCEAFTTLRIFNPRKYHRGQRYRVTLHRRGELGIAQLVDLLTLRYSEITPAIAYIDTGYDLETFKSILCRMYASRTQDFGHSMWNLLILKWETRT